MHIKNPTSFLYSESSETPTMAACDLTLCFSLNKNVRYKKKTSKNKMKSLFLSSASNNTQSWVLLQRKIRDQGSNFSHETVGLLASSLQKE